MWQKFRVTYFYAAEAVRYCAIFVITLICDMIISMRQNLLLFEDKPHFTVVPQALALIKATEESVILSHVHALTGSYRNGKDSVAAAIGNEHGIPTAPEAATDFIVRCLVDSHAIPEIPDIQTFVDKMENDDFYAAFQQEVLYHGLVRWLTRPEEQTIRQLNESEEASTKVALANRTPLDAIAHMQIRNLDVPDKWIEHANILKFANQVVLLDRIDGLDFENGGNRAQSSNDDADPLQSACQVTYEQAGYKTTSLPSVPTRDDQFLNVPYFTGLAKQQIVEASISERAKLLFNLLTDQGSAL